MANKDFERMIKLGEWLEEYLTPDIPNWKLLEIFQAGAKLIGVKEKFSPDCRIALCLEDKLVLTEKKVSPSGRSFLPVSQGIDREKNEKKGTKTFNAQEIESIKQKTHVFLKYGRNVDKVLKKIHKYKLPWGKVLIEIEKDEFLYSFTGQLRASYAELKEIIKKRDGEYQVTKSLSGIDYLAPIKKMIKERVQKGLSTEDPAEEFLFSNSSENPTFELIQEINRKNQVNYRIIIARILFDFLILGGQEYFLFCEQCGRFTVIRRKGRKKFCSDICRTNYGREKLARA